MAFLITDGCVNCALCVPVCPNNGIRMGEAVYVIDSAACTECVGFFNTQQCAVVCPVSCCILDPRNVGTEAALFERAKEIHAGSNKQPTLTAQTSYLRKRAAWWQRLYRLVSCSTAAEDATKQLEVENCSSGHAGT